MNVPNSNRRNVLKMAGAASAAALAAAAVNSSEEAHAANITGAFASSPCGGDDSGLLKDAAAYGKILGPGVYRLMKNIELANITWIGLPGQTTIEIHSETGITTNDRYGYLYVSGIGFECDPSATKSVLRNTYTGDNVARFKIIEDCWFHNFKGPALTFAQTDNPYYKINRCQFFGASSTTSSGIAFADAADQTSITDCAFTEVRTGVFFGKAGNRSHIERCDFVHNTTANFARQNVWIEPMPVLANSGVGMSIINTKFGNENRSPNDYYILYADVSTNGIYSGAKYPGEFLPKMSNSSGYAGLQIINGNDFSGAGTTANLRSPISSWTPNLVGCQYGPNVHSGTPAKYELEFLGAKPTYSMGTRIDVGTSWGTDVAPTNANSSFFKIIS